MARKHGDIVAERKQFRLDPTEEQVAIALRQIPAADAAREQNIAANQQVIFPGKEAEASRTMPGHFEYLHLEAKKIAPRRRFDQKIRLDRFDFQFEAKP